jgi:putative transposase
VWTADFKGEFRLQRGPYCFPLTVLDLYSHYLLGCAALPSTAVAPTQRIFERLFREYGLPQVLRTDNGVPFAQANALGRLGALGFWWVRLGIRPEHIALGRPAENGAHERFHKTLAAATTRPTASSFRAQQRRFDAFHTEYNTERPHESVLDHRPPGYVYTPAPRPYPTRLPEIVYPTTATVRLVEQNGNIKWHNQPIFLSTNLAGQHVGLLETTSDRIAIVYAALQLGEFDPHTRRFLPRVRWDGGW